MNGGARRIRTDDPLNANQVLSQLSYSPADANPAHLSPIVSDSRLPLFVLPRVALLEDVA